MTRDRQLLIVTGAILIALLVAIAAFSLGVYVGVHGWTPRPPSVAGPGANPPRPPDPDAQPPQPPAPDNQDQPGPLPQPQLVGQVRSVSPDTITLDTPQGPRLFELADDVQVSRRNPNSPGQEPATVDDVVPGEHLALYGRFEGNGARQLIAERLVLLPPPSQKQP